MATRTVMHRPFTTRVAFLLAFVAMISGTKISTAAPPLEQVLPDNTLAFLEIPKLSEFRQGFSLTSVGKLWADESFAGFRKELANQGQDLNARIQNLYGLTPQQIFAAVDERLVVAGIRTQEGSLSFTFFLLVTDQNKAQQLAQAAVTHLKSKGGRSVETQLPVKADVLQMPNSKEQIVFANMDQYLMISGDVEIARTIMTRWSQEAPEGGLSSTEEFKQCMQQSSGDSPSALRWFAIPMHLAVAANYEKSQTKAAKAKMSDPRPFPLRHGFPGIRGMAGQLWLNQAPFDMSGRVAIFAPPPREEVLKCLEFVPGPLSFSKMVPQGVSSCTLMRWNLDSILPNLGGVYDDVTDSPGAFAGTLADFKSEIGVDLEGVVFPMLGPQMCIFNLPDAKIKRERSLIAIEIKDPAKNEAKAAAAMYGLLAEDTGARRRKLVGHKFDLWQIRLKAAGAEQALSNAGVMVANGHLWLASHDSLIEEVVLNRFSEDLSQAQDFQAFNQVWQPLADPKSQVAFTFSRTDLGMQQVYDALRREGIAGLETTESLYATLLLKLFSATEQTKQVNFNSLPEFESIQKYFGLLGICFHNQDSGWLATFGSHTQH